MLFELGRTDAGPLRCDLDALVDTRVLVQANSGGGKSWCLRRLLEQTFGHVQHLVIDPEGEFASLRERFDYVLAARRGGDTAAEPRAAKLLAERLLELRASAILDIYELQAHERIRFVRLFLEALVDAPKRLWHPALIVVDEAHVYCPQKGEAESAGAVIDLATRGRKRGFSAVLATQRLSKLHKDAAAECNNKLVGRTGLDIDMKRAGEELGFSSRDDAAALRTLRPGEFFCYGPAFADGITRVTVGPVVTTHPKAGARIAFKAPPPSAKLRALLPQLADLPAEAEEKRKSLDDLKRELADTRRRLTIAERAQPVSAPPSEELIARRVAAALTGERKASDAQRRLLAGLIGHVAKAMPPLRAALDGVEGSVARLAVALDGQAERPIPSPVMSSPVSPPARLAPEAAPPRRMSAPVSNNGTGDLTGIRAGAVRILRELARRHPLYWTKAQVAQLTGFTASGGTFTTYIGDLKRAGLIDVAANDVRVTDAGLDAAGEVPDAPASHEEIMEMWRDKMRAGEYRLLEAIAAAGADGIDRGALAETTEYTMTGGTFTTYIGTLRRNGLIEQRGSLLVPSAMLWPEDA